MLEELNARKVFILKQLFQDPTKITVVIFMHSLSLSMLGYIAEVP